ncbi:uncharacterized protein LOC129319064 [Prosopis cineraria]|uniref:uncharacterized protein LOC129319064 n=1 Tax=Prosopis cineraria TaxID=364024 RepID=UPI00240ED248|nr:uncharacterized protein LOC129319064 [Prosopis cineraria]XP_054820070.1 uncharacterized protein LOC129319064 [Prosopis cineraria]
MRGLHQFVYFFLLYDSKNIAKFIINLHYRWKRLGVILRPSLQSVYIWDPISRGARYLFFFNQFIGDFKNAREDLEVKLADMENRKEEADRKTKEIMPYVKKWLDDVHAILEAVQNLQHEVEEGGAKKCLNVPRRNIL